MRSTPLITSGLVLLASCALLTAQNRNKDLGSFANKFKGKWVQGQHGKLRYQFFAPATIPRNTSLPVVVSLHGSSECGDDNKKQLNTPGAYTFANRNEKWPCIVIAPQCWSGTTWMAAGGNEVLALLDQLLKEVRVADKKRVYLTGFSLGGFGTYHLLALRPDLFAAAIPVAGGSRPELAAKFKDVKFWIFHGRKDPNVKVIRAQQMAAALKKLGASVKYTEFKHASHGIQKKVYNDLAVPAWLFKQRKD